MSGLSSKMPKSSMAIFAVVLAAIVVLLFFTHGSVAPLWLRWAVAGVWALSTLILGIRYLVLTRDPQGMAADGPGFRRMPSGSWYSPPQLATTGARVLIPLIPERCSDKHEIQAASP